jgi:lantibiotic modifying enzyme
MSHGACGYAYALTQLGLATGKPEYQNAASEALAYERSLFSWEARNWPDLRQRTGDGVPLAFMAGWCHGAPGAALARIGCLEVIDDAEIRQEIDVALQTTLDESLSSQDDTCCGNFSRISTLLTASRRLDRPDLHQAALVRASAVVQRADAAGAFRLDPDIGSALNPGFMKGVAGIGYELLRLAEADHSLPTPLLMGQS